jgi:hypothetical protein
MPSIINATTTTGVAVTGDNSGALALQTNNGTTAVTIDTSQNVGIGTTSPTTYGASVKLAVKSDGTAQTWTVGGVASGAYAFFSNNNQSATTSVFYLGQGWATGSDNIGFLNTNGENPILFATNGSERVRTTGNGYFKASNNGTYVSASGTYHEFRNTASDPVIFLTGTDASYGSNGIIEDITRSASSGYNFAALRSGASGSQDAEFILRGDGNAYADGTWNNNGADYAEYFESATGQVIPTGSTVVLENNKVRLATVTDNPDDVIGVVRPKEPSKASMMIGNTAWNKWANKYLTDDFDRFIMEEHDVVEWTDEDGKEYSYESHNIPANVVVPTNAVSKTHDANGIKFQHYKLNPEWNPDAEYVNRENRDEWLIIGLIGQVKILKGQVMGERWKKMRDVSQSVQEWFIR